MNLNFNPAENELLLTETAAVRDSENGAEVKLVPSHKTLCHCSSAAHAHLIRKLFNKGLQIPS